MLEAGRTLPTAESAVLLFRLHGAAARVPVTDTACALRGARWDINVIAQWSQLGESEQHKEWPRRIWKQLHGFSVAEAYINHLSADDGSERVRASFGQNYGRLAGIKRLYDPENLFRLNPNIHPQ